MGDNPVHAFLLQNPIDEFPEDVLLDVKAICEEYSDVLEASKLTRDSIVLHGQDSNPTKRKITFNTNQTVLCRYIKYGKAYNEPICMILL